MLGTWNKTKGEDASYLKLADALYQHGRRDLLELLCENITLAIGSSLGSSDPDMSSEISTETYYAASSRGILTTPTSGLSCVLQLVWSNSITITSHVCAHFILISPNCEDH